MCYLNVFLYPCIPDRLFRTKLTDSFAVFEEIFNYTWMLLGPVMTKTSLWMNSPLWYSWGTTCLTRWSSVSHLKQGGVDFLYSKLLLSYKRNDHYHINETTITIYIYETGRMRVIKSLMRVGGSVAQKAGQTRPRRVTWHVWIFIYATLAFSFTQLFLYLSMHSFHASRPNTPLSHQLLSWSRVTLVFYFHSFTA